MSKPCENCGSDLRVCVDCDLYNGKYIEIPDNATNGKYTLINYCLKHNGEEIYEFIKRLFDESLGWTDSRSFIVDWLEKGDK